MKVGVPNEADLKLHLKTGYYKYQEDKLFQLTGSLDRKLKKRPPPYTLSYSEKPRSALRSLSSSRLAKNSDNCLALKRITSTNPGLFAAGYLWTFIKVCTPSTFTATCWSIALSAIHLLLYFPSYPWKGNTVIYRRYEKMHYFPVQKKNFDNIHFKRRPESGCSFQKRKSACVVAFSQTKAVGIVSMSLKASYCCDAKACEDYYVNQAGNGMAFFAGAQQQKGYGLGGVSASIGCAVMPLFKPGARAIGREVLRSGMQFASNVLEGQNVKQAAVRRAKQAG